MATISINDLVTQLATLGVVATAAIGSFHKLPGSGGTGPAPASNVRMLKVTLNKAPGPAGFGSATVTYGFPAPVAGPFTQVMLESLSDDYEYKLNFFPNPDGLTGTITAAAVAYESQDPDLAFPRDVLVRIEPFEQTVDPV